MSDTATRLWPTLSFENADTMTDWLQAIGFTPLRVFRTDGDTGSIIHAELLWPEGGGVMYGTHDPDNTLDGRPGQSAIYLVTDDVPGTLTSAVDAGATVVRDVVEEDFGGQAATVRDPEGNTWTFGRYQPM
ncbi:VOC family protein [Nocardia sp. NPDC058499]|uniref:VOC family protein n=1 Tax=Nocardia sp. NPDC058499 TaxID=3346530 RepID=UPI00364F8FB0